MQIVRSYERNADNATDAVERMAWTFAISALLNAADAVANGADALEAMAGLRLPLRVVGEAARALELGSVAL